MKAILLVITFLFSVSSLAGITTCNLDESINSNRIHENESVKAYEANHHKKTIVVQTTDGDIHSFKCGSINASIKMFQGCVSATGTWLPNSFIYVTNKKEARKSSYKLAYDCD